MYEKSKRRYNIILIMLLFAAGAGFFFSCSKTAKEDTSQIEFYTCAMHPSVKEKKPGSCPICGMDLIPVMKKTESDSQAVNLTFQVDQEKLQLIGVKTTPAQKIHLQKVIRAVGRVDYNEKRLAVVNLKFMGWIEKLYADYTGQAVKKGEAMFDIYSPDLFATQQELLNARKLSLPAQSTSERAGDSLRATNNNQPVNREMLNNIRQRLLLSGMAEEQIQRIEKTGQPETRITIYSPIDGVIINKTAVAGMYVEPGMELYKIADLATVWIYADIYENEIPYIAVNQVAGITLGSRPDQVFTGKIIFIFPYLDATTRTVRVRMEMPNSRGLFKPEMFAHVTMAANLGVKLAVPTNAVINTGKKQVVFIVKSAGLLEARLVQTGVNAGEYIEIITGVKEGENVVSNANFLIDAESKIQGILESDKSETAEPVMPEMPGMDHSH